MSCSDTLAQENGVFGFDARAISKRFRHAAIFGALESLNDGDVMRFQNDHDPLPLLDQIRHRYGDQIKIDYVAREPGNIVIDFRVQLGAYAEAAAQQSAGGGCGGNGAGGCGCGN
ncbi:MULTISPECIES: DUF2249 domain-containing protein [unclassified Niveibacterium]|uniref:DUF2249 domain-containing protein n=1 Tax=unclassified Niveibacterium TaxID=2648924 RepID=UPI001552FAF4|nr:DUF2249 domain-containing protein [Niveibacterium sp. COAC-50]